MLLIIISIEGIEALLTKLDTNKSAGPDQISASSTSAYQGSFFPANIPN